MKDIAIKIMIFFFQDHYMKTEETLTKHEKDGLNMRLNRNFHNRENCYRCEGNMQYILCV